VSQNFYQWYATTTNPTTVAVLPTYGTGGGYPLPVVGFPPKRYPEDPVGWLRQRVDEALEWAA
jgi:hypothetical protein